MNPPSHATPDAPQYHLIYETANGVWTPQSSLGDPGMPFIVEDPIEWIKLHGRITTEYRFHQLPSGPTFRVEPERELAVGEPTEDGDEWYNEEGENWLPHENEGLKWNKDGTCRYRRPAHLVAIPDAPPICSCPSGTVGATQCPIHNPPDSISSETPINGGEYNYETLPHEERVKAFELWKQKKLSSETTNPDEVDIEINDTALEDKTTPHTDWVRADFARRLLKERDAARAEGERMLEPLRAIVPHTYGDAVMQKVDLGDLPNHEWDNKTTEEQAAWLIRHQATELTRLRQRSADAERDTETLRIMKGNCALAQTALTFGDCALAMTYLERVLAVTPGGRP